MSDKLIDQLRKDVDELGDTPLGRTILAVLSIEERLREVTAWMERTSEYDREQLER